MRRTFLGVLVAILCLLPGTAVAEDSPGGRLPSEYPASGTPHVLDGSVYAVAQVGGFIVLGGDFTTARDDDSDIQLTRNDLLAFDVDTGHISTTFIPNPNGVVRAVLPAGDGTSVYVAGNFTSIGGVARSRLARVRVSDGAVLSTFNPGTISGQVRDLALLNGRLWLAGAFTHVNGNRQPGLATVNPVTGRFDPYMGLAVAGVQQSGTTEVLKIDADPAGSRLVAIGNFATLGGVSNPGLFMIDTSGASAAPSNFRTSFYAAACSASFDSYMRDVSFAPDGRFFVVVTTGAYRGAGSPCDSSARFEANGSGLVSPSWVDNTGGDTTYSVEVTDGVVYVGGHMRWENNPFAGDKAGPGAVAREGIAALDPINGLPLSWDPGRTKGVGAFDLLYTSQGLWVASDTDRIGHYTYKGRIALMPINGGASFPPVHTPDLPDAVYSGGSFSASPPPSTLSRRMYDGSAVGSAQTVPTGGIDWNAVRGAFMLNGQLYLGQGDGSFTRRTFDGSGYGPAVPVNTSDQIVTLSAWHTDISQSTGMFYDSGRIYFTLTGSNNLYYRYFSPQADVVGAQRYVASANVSGISFSQVRGMFATASRLYWGTSDGRLHRINWLQGAQSGSPVADTAAIVSGPGTDTAVWGSRAMFLFQDASGRGMPLPPTASFTSSCTSLTCALDASGSSTNGASATYAWEFGDGQSGSGVSPQHTYAASGSYPVTLTVTTSGGTSTVTGTVSATRVNEPPTAAFSYTCSALRCSFDAGASADADGTIASYAWSFGDGTTATGATPQHTYADAGARMVQLEVTDNDGATASTSKEVTVSAAAVGFVAAVSTNASTTNARVTVPGSVQPGDTMVLYLTANSTGAALTPPEGWTQLESVTGDNILGTAWTRTAALGDAGSAVSVALSTTVKAALTLSVYRGSDGAATAVTAHAGAVDQTLGTTHRAPGVTTTGTGQWVATYWAAKASSAVAWTVPPDQVVRASSTTSGGGLVSVVAADSGAPVPAGLIPGLVGTTSIDVSRVVMFTVAIGLG
jgi:PKD repeat protein